MRKLFWVGLAIASTIACTKNVPQDGKSGEDGRNKGAVEMKLENNEATSRGIVTYPGGDRVDWKVIDLPKGQVGTLELRLRWTPPRPGLDLSFNVYNEYGRLLEAAKPNTRSKSRKTNKLLTVNEAQGKLLIEIYASGRGDAGRYTLTAEWKPTIDDGGLDWLATEVLDPPRLPAVPEPMKPCSPFDKANPACKDTCDVAAFDPTWPPCANICPPVPDPKIKACKLCNKDALDPCLPDCLQFYPSCDIAKPDYTNPKCKGVSRRPQDGEVTDVKSNGSGSTITINLGLVDGLDKTWTGVLLDGNGNPLKNTDFKPTTIGKNASVAKIKLDPVPANVTVRMSPTGAPAPMVCKP